MSGWAIPAAVCLGLAAGVLSGVFGVGGGILFVPTAATGALRQRAYGNLRLRAAVVVGAVSIVGAELGVQIATRVDEDVIRRAFGILLLVVAARLALGMARQGRRYPDVS